MYKIFLLFSIMALLASGGCYFPPVRLPIYTYQCIVPECSGRITDLNGKPLKDVRIRIISYGKVASAYSDVNGNFKLKPLYKWVGMQYKHTLDEDDGTFDDISIAGKPDTFFGEMALFIETSQEHFLLEGMNAFPAKYDHWQMFYIVSNYKSGMFDLFVPCANKTSIQLRDFPRDDEEYARVRNPWDNIYYTFYGQISWTTYLKKQQFQTFYSLVSFDQSFVQWMKSKAYTKEMYETAKKEIKARRKKFWHHML